MKRFLFSFLLIIAFCQGARAQAYANEIAAFKRQDSIHRGASPHSRMQSSATTHARQAHRRINAGFCQRNAVTLQARSTMALLFIAAVMRKVSTGYVRPPSCSGSVTTPCAAGSMTER